MTTDQLIALWRDRGLPLKVAIALSQENLETIEDLRRLTDDQIISFVGIGPKAMSQIKAILSASREG